MNDPAPLREVTSAGEVTSKVGTCGYCGATFPLTPGQPVAHCTKGHQRAAARARARLRHAQRAVDAEARRTAWADREDRMRTARANRVPCPRPDKHRWVDPGDGAPTLAGMRRAQVDGWQWLNLYECDCGYWHIGNLTPDNPLLSRALDTP